MSLWTRARDRRLRTLPVAFRIPTWEMRPRIVTASVAYFVEDVGLWATPAGMLSTAYLEGEYLYLVELARTELRTMAQGVISGQLSVGELRLRAARLLSDLHWDAALLAGGPFNGLPLPIAQATRAALDAELRYLDGVMADVIAGRQSLDGTLRTRMGMYGSAGWGTLQGVYGIRAGMMGFQFEENVLGVAEHCEGCIAETAKGRVPIGTLVPVGDRDCLSNCKCRIVFS